MFIKEVIIRDGKTLFRAMSKTRSYTYWELQDLTSLTCESLCYAILQLLQEHKISQILRGPSIRYVVI